MKQTYTAFVYYHGQLSNWSGKLNELEIIHEVRAPWLWMARALALRYCGSRGRCGYFMVRGEETIEHMQAPKPALAQVS